jgi:hypothetical protein
LRVLLLKQGIASSLQFQADPYVEGIEAT